MVNSSAAPARAGGIRLHRSALRIGLSTAALLLTGTALVPARAADVVSLGGVIFDAGTASPFTTGLNPARVTPPHVITHGDLRITATQDSSFGGNLTDEGGVFAFRVYSPHTVTLSGVNTYSGLTSLLAGSLVAGSNTALSAASTISFTGNATLDIANHQVAIRNLVGAQGLVTGRAGGTLTVNADCAGQNPVFAG